MLDVKLACLEEVMTLPGVMIVRLDFTHLAVISHHANLVLLVIMEAERRNKHSVWLVLLEHGRHSWEQLLPMCPHVRPAWLVNILRFLAEMLQHA